MGYKQNTEIINSSFLYISFFAISIFPGCRDGVGMGVGCVGMGVRGKVIWHQKPVSLLTKYFVNNIWHYHKKDTI